MQSPSECGMRRFYPCFLCLWCVGCGLPQDEWGVVRAVWNEFPWWSIIWRVTIWSVIGVVLGLVIGLAVTLLLHRLGWYRTPWPKVSPWLVGLVYVLNLVGLISVGASWGFCEGAHRAAEVGIRNSLIGKELLPKIATHGADALIYLDAAMEDGQPPDWNELLRQRQHLDVPKFLGRLEKAKSEVADSVTAKTKEKLFEKNPDWKGGLAETVIDWTLPNLLRYLVDHELRGKLEKKGLGQLLSELQNKAGEGPLPRAELAGFLSDRVLTPMVFYPIGRYLIGLQKIAWLIGVAILAIPPALFWLARRIWGSTPTANTKPNIESPNTKKP